jgi:hypothetical protein
MRVYISNLASNQYVPEDDGKDATQKMIDADIDSANIPSWTLQIQGKLLDVRIMVG